MHELIKINYGTEKPTISARDLHEGLEIGTQYSKWFDRMCEYGFVENADYITISQKRLTAQGNETTFKDHEITVDMAKEICMIQRSEKGKQYRQYFLALEKAWNKPEQVMARAIKMADKTINYLKVENKELKDENQKMIPKVVFAEAVTTSKDCISIGALSKILNQNGIEIGRNRLFMWLRAHGYLMTKDGGDSNLPTQKAMNLKIFEIQESTRIQSDGSIKIDTTTKVNGKGQLYFINKFKNLSNEASGE